MSSKVFDLPEKKKRLWPKSGSSSLSFEPHSCAYCGGHRCHLVGVESHAHGLWTLVIDCAGCGSRDRPVLEESALLALARLEG
jgi:hypothetical protein